MSLNDTPRADRLHIGLFGKRNSGKSSLINALTGQDIAIVSDTPGTTSTQFSSQWNCILWGLWSSSIPQASTTIRESWGS